MIPEEAKLTSANSWRQLAPNAHELEEVTSYTKHILHERDMKVMLIKVPNASLMFNANHGDDNYVADGLNNNSSMFPYIWDPTTM